jgi:tetratricopeptide (TPR) repeat protein
VLARARALLAPEAAQVAPLSDRLDLAETLGAVSGGSRRRVYQDRELTARARLVRAQTVWAASLRDRLPADVPAASLWLSLACSPLGSALPDIGDRESVLGDLLATPLIAFEWASGCQGPDRARLEGLLANDPRFVEVDYFLGLSALSGQLGAEKPIVRPDLDEADRYFRLAFEWRQNWPSLTLAIANVAVTAEDFDRAVAFYERTLVMVPNHPAAFVGKIRSLTYLGRHEDAIATADAMIVAEASPGEARYWRAYNQTALERYDQAWDDIEQASRLMINADVPKLAGIIAINRRDLATARERLELALARHAAGCDTGFYLQAVLSAQREWDPAARVAGEAASCFDAEIEGLTREIEDVRTSDAPSARKARQIARRQSQLDGDRRMRATTWFNAAAANFNLARTDEAREFAGKVLDDPQFAVRAREILDRTTPR